MNTMTKDFKPTMAEELFCIPLDQQEARQPLDREQVEVFMALLYATDEDMIAMFDEMLKESTLLRILLQRLKTLNLLLDRKTMVMIVVLSQRVGDLIMYVYFLAYKAKKLEKMRLDFNDFIAIFPMGYWNDVQLDKAWHSQKYKGINLLDIPEAVVSLVLNNEVLEEWRNKKR